jgi:drug/metabolite transporter (DMT)-like permease
VGAWAAVITLALFCTALAFVVFTVLIREAGTSRATVITYVNPVVALALGTWLEAEHPGAGALAGLALILAGSWLSTGAGTGIGTGVLRARGRGADGESVPRSPADRLLD